MYCLFFLFCVCFDDSLQGMPLFMAKNLTSYHSVLVKEILDECQFFFEEKYVLSLQYNVW